MLSGLRLFFLGRIDLPYDKEFVTHYTRKHRDAAAGAPVKTGLPAAELGPALAPSLKTKDAIVRQRARRVLSAVKSRP